MKTKKIFLGLFISLFIMSCSTEEITEDNPKLVNNTTSNKLSSKSSLDNKSSTVNIDYGMPFEDQYLHESDLIKIRYHINSNDTKFDIRHKFSRKYPNLVLVKVSTERNPIEYWFFKLEDTSQHRGDTPYRYPDEDKDPQSKNDSYKSLLKDIESHTLIDLYD